MPDIASCHASCFPKSLATKLGSTYVQKTLEWFLDNPNRFLFHIVRDKKVIGYCGGFIPVKPGDGSSSGMLQYAFKEAIRGIMTKPFLLFHPEVVQNYPFLWMNIKRKLTGRTKPFKPTEPKLFKPYVGLVVIGVHPGFQGKGLAKLLMDEFENRSRQFKQAEMVLSVKKDNTKAIRAYSKSGWTIREENEKTFVLHKHI